MSVPKPAVLRRPLPRRPLLLLAPTQHRCNSRQLRYVATQAHNTIGKISSAISQQLTRKIRTAPWLLSHVDGKPLGYIPTAGSSGHRELFIEMRVNDELHHRLRWDEERKVVCSQRSRDPIDPGAGDDIHRALLLALRACAAANKMSVPAWSPEHRCYKTILPPNPIHGPTPLTIMVYFVFPTSSHGSKLWFDTTAASGIAPISSNWLTDHLMTLPLASLE